MATILTQTQANWQLICILGAFDLYCNRTTPAYGTPEGTWLAGELERFNEAAEAILATNLCSADFQTIGKAFASRNPGDPHYMGNWSQYRAIWVSYLTKPTAFDGVSFGAWIQKKIRVTDLIWGTGPITQTEEDLSFYTVLFFASLENLFIGSLSDVESYWNCYTPGSPQLNITTASAVILAAYYGVAPPKISPPASYASIVSYLGDICNYNNFGYAPYPVDPQGDLGYTTFYKKLQNLPPSAPVLADSCSFHAQLFIEYAKRSSAPGKMVVGLTDFGGYFDVAVSIYNRFTDLTSQYMPIRSGNIPLEKLSGFINSFTTDTNGLLVAFQPTNTPDPTNSYYGFYQSNAWKTDTTGSSAPCNFKNAVDPAGWTFTIRVPLMITDPLTYGPFTVENYVLPTPFPYNSDGGTLVNFNDVNFDTSCTSPMFHWLWDNNQHGDWTQGAIYWLEQEIGTDPSPIEKTFGNFDVKVSKPMYWNLCLQISGDTLDHYPDVTFSLASTSGYMALSGALNLMLLGSSSKGFKEEAA